MCIISIKKKGIKFQSEKIVKTMCKNNSHGFSMVVSVDGKKPRIFKTLDMTAFLQAYRTMVRSNDYRKTSVFIHARIKTHGTQRIENCHGWRSDGLVFAHNGILSIENRNDMTDSETFFRDIFAPIYRLGGWKMAEKAINAVIGTSKFVFMDEDGEVRHYGKYIEADGVLYSNDSYTEREWCYPTAGRWGGTWNTNGYYPKTKSSAFDWNEDFLTQE